MDGFDNSENFGALFSMCSPRERKNLKKGYVYGREFQDMLDSLDDEDGSEEARRSMEKKRRLSLVQVKVLEKSFDVDNKLEAERKLKLARELGMQPRQVAIWFQNRRARWKAKQLEKDYDILKADYDALKLEYDNLEQEKAALTKELSNLEAELGQENAWGSCDVKVELLESAYVESQQSKIQDQCRNGNQTWMNMSSLIEDRSSHCDSNGVPLEVGNVGAQLLSYPTDYFHVNGVSLSSSSFPTISWFQNSRKTPQLQFVKMEDQDLSSADEPRNLFSADQAPTLDWYLP